VRLKVETLEKAIVVPTSAVQRGPAGTFSYVIGPDNVATCEACRGDAAERKRRRDRERAHDVGSRRDHGLCESVRRRQVLIGTDDRAPTADLAPRKRSRSPDAKGDSKGGQGKDGQRRKVKPGKVRARMASTAARRERGEGDQKGQTGPAPAEPSGGAAKSQP
jgi:multidrug efflux system membrane fusion protein